MCMSTHLSTPDVSDYTSIGLKWYQLKINIINPILLDGQFIMGRLSSFHFFLFSFSFQILDMAPNGNNYTWYHV